MPVPLYQVKAEFFRMLGHPVRIRVLELLQDGPMPVRELLAAIEVEPSALSQQLAVLRRSGIVTSTRNGATVVYALAERGRRAADAGRAADPDRGPDRAERAARGAARVQGCGLVSVNTALTAVLGRVRSVLPARADYAVMARNPRRDLLVGLTVAIVALPLALGFGVSSGLGAEAGLATAVVAGALAALFGGSNLQVSGPTGDDRRFGADRRPVRARRCPDRRADGRMCS